MKLITFTVPCYNSQEYMRHCIESLLKGGEEVEIIIVNDGSTDGTSMIAHEYEEKYPTGVRVVDKENGGHGSGVNVGVHNASGLYLKIVDSDDWLDENALLTLLDKIREHLNEGNLPDLYICNYVYVHDSDHTAWVSDYKKQLNEGFVNWNKVGTFHFARTLMMHSLIYNTEKLREHYVELPEHTFYVDNIYAYAPIPYMRKAFYLNVNLYQYYIGRDGQSINIHTCMKRYEQQIKVQLIMCKAHKYDFLKTLPKGMKKYLFHDLHAVMMNTLMFTWGINTKERRRAARDMWKEIKRYDKKMYNLIRFRGYPLSVIYMPAFLRPKIMMFAYKIVARKYKLG